MKLVALAATVAAACGSTPPPATSAGRAEVPPRPAPPTCAEIALIMRGPVDAGDESAGPERVKAIEMSCTQDHWPQPAIACAASTTQPTDCLHLLSDAQRSGYDRRLRAWAQTYGVSLDPQAPPPPPPIDCSDALHAPDLIDPALDDSHPEHAWSAAERLRALTISCEQDAWSEALKACLRDAVTGDATQACDVGAKVHKQLADIRDVANAIATLRKKPKQLDCKHVVEHHYGDAKWAGKLPDMPPAERKKTIAASRAAMLRSCTRDGWDERTRACVIADGGDVCFGTGIRWGYPFGGASGTGVAECDAYAMRVVAFVACDKMPIQARDAVRQAYDSAAGSWSGIPTEARDSLAPACKAGADAIDAAMKGSGC